MGSTGTLHYRSIVCAFNAVTYAIGLMKIFILFYGLMYSFD